MPEDTGGGDAGPSSQAPDKPKKKMKFAPVIRSRSKKTGHMAKSEKARSQNVSEIFKDLLPAAQADAQWERGSNRTFRKFDDQVGSVAFGAQDKAGGPKTGFGSRGTWGGGEGAGVKVEGGGWPFDDGKLGKDKDKEEEDEGPVLDYASYYPTLLPIRPMEEEVFNDDGDLSHLVPKEEPIAQSCDDKEETMAASELGLDRRSGQGLILFQLPSVVPVLAPNVDELRRKPVGSGSQSNPDKKMATVTKALPAGKIGKLLVFKSGKVKLRIGDVLLDVLGGTPYNFRQETVAVNVGDNDGHCVFMGDVRRRAVCTVNAFQLLNEQPIPEFKRWTGNRPGMDQAPGVDRMETDAGVVNNGEGSGQMATEMDVDVKAEQGVIRTDTASDNPVEPERKKKEKKEKKDKKKKKKKKKESKDRELDADNGGAEIKVEKQENWGKLVGGLEGVPVDGLDVNRDDGQDVMMDEVQGNEDDLAEGAPDDD